MIDKYTEEREPISSLALMERASRAWTDSFLSFSFDFDRVVVLCGNGNNGGDGFVIARLLVQEGKQVDIWVPEGQNRRSPDCQTNFLKWKEMGKDVTVCRCGEEIRLSDRDIVVDALFGSGLNRPLEGPAAELVRAVNASPAKVVAVDIPSGLMGEDNGHNNREIIMKADYTFTFQFPKFAFLLPENCDFVGCWRILDIGLHPDAVRNTPTDWFCTGMDDIRHILPRPSVFAHKGMNGKALLVAGSSGMMGAALLAAEAAVRSGCGLLYAHVPSKGGVLMQMKVPEAVLDADESEEYFSNAANLDRYDAIAVGPGIGRNPETAAALKRLLHDRKGRLVLDADALNLMAEHREMLDDLNEECILTPHFKEFERLAGKCRNDFERLNKLGKFAQCYKTYVVLKGAYSVIATPGGRLYFNMSGNPGMAKAGSGDVLTGVMLALAAGNMSVEAAARSAVFAHGLSADMLVAENGFRGISSGMIAGNMSRAWGKIENIGNKPYGM